MSLIRDSLTTSTKVCVAVRFRPLIERERASNDLINWNVEQKVVTQIDPKTKLRTSNYPPYNFDHVFSSEQNTKVVYDQVVAPIVQNAINGFNGTILCYGQTSSGKTFTLYGNDEEEGILSLTSQDLFQRISSDNTRTYIIRVGLVEIYNEHVSDLLSSERSNEVQIVEQNGSVVPKNLEEIQILKPEDLIEATKRIQRERKIGETQMNKESSRSHTILRILIESVPKEPDGSEENIQVTNALLNFVDLAGSEKAGQTGAIGERFKEATFINKSLSVLSQVVNQLSDEPSIHPASVLNTNRNSSVVGTSKRANTKYVNFRDSKLTRILQSSLSGNAFIVMILNVTPASVDETHSTLRFGRSAKKIETKPTPNHLLASNSEYQKKIKELQLLLHGKSSEVEDLKKQLGIYMKFCHPKTPDENKLPKMNSSYLAPPTERRKTFCSSLFFSSRKATDPPLFNSNSGMNLSLLVPDGNFAQNKTKRASLGISDEVLNEGEKEFMSHDEAVREFELLSQNQKRTFSQSSTWSSGELSSSVEEVSKYSTGIQTDPTTPLPPKRFKREEGSESDEVKTVEKSKRGSGILRVANSLLSVQLEEERAGFGEEKEFLNAELEILKEENQKLNNELIKATQERKEAEKSLKESEFLLMEKLRESESRRRDLENKLDGLIGTQQPPQEDNLEKSSEKVEIYEEIAPEVTLIRSQLEDLLKVLPKEEQESFITEKFYADACNSPIMFSNSTISTSTSFDTETFHTATNTSLIHENTLLISPETHCFSTQTDIGILAHDLPYKFIPYVELVHAATCTTKTELKEISTNTQLLITSEISTSTQDLESKPPKLVETESVFTSTEDLVSLNKKSVSVFTSTCDLVCTNNSSTLTENLGNFDSVSISTSTSDLIDYSENRTISASTSTHDLIATNFSSTSTADLVGSISESTSTADLVSVNCHAIYTSTDDLVNVNYMSTSTADLIISNYAATCTSDLALDNVNNNSIYTSTGDLANYNRNSISTSTDDLVNTNSISSSTADLVNLNLHSISTSTGDLVNSNSISTSTLDFVNSNSISTNTGDLVNTNSMSTSTGDLVNSNTISTSTLDLVNLNLLSISTSTGDLVNTNSISTSTLDFVNLNLNSISTSTGDLVNTNSNSTSTGDLVNLASISCSTGDFFKYESNSTSTADLVEFKSVGNSTELLVEKVSLVTSETNTEFFPVFSVGTSMEFCKSVENGSQTPCLKYVDNFTNTTENGVLATSEGNLNPGPGKRVLTTNRQTQTVENDELRTACRELRLRVMTVEAQAELTRKKHLLELDSEKKRILEAERKVAEKDSKISQLSEKISSLIEKEKENLEIRLNSVNKTSEEVQCDLLKDILSSSLNGNFGLLPEGYPEVASLVCENKRLRRTIMQNTAEKKNELKIEASTLTNYVKPEPFIIQPRPKVPFSLKTLSNQNEEKSYNNSSSSAASRFSNIRPILPKSQSQSETTSSNKFQNLLRATSSLPSSTIPLNVPNKSHQNIPNFSQNAQILTQITPKSSENLEKSEREMSVEESKSEKEIEYFDEYERELYELLK